MLENGDIQQVVSGRSKNSTAKLTLEIRKHQEAYLFDLMRDKSDEDKLRIVHDHVEQLNEAIYEMYERIRASAKIKDDILIEIEKLHAKEVKKWDRENPEKLFNTIDKVEKKTTDKFSKAAAQFRKLHFSEEMIAQALRDMGCTRIQEVLKNA